MGGHLVTDLFSQNDLELSDRLRMFVYCTVNGVMNVEDFMATFTPNVKQVEALVGALDLKLQSLKRAQKGASASFAEVYEAEIRMYNGLIDLVKGAKS